jgi:Uncharacterized protein conserved in bacteria C-term(DUF2220)
MDAIAQQLLEKLLVIGNKAAAGVRSRAAALTAAHMADYHGLRSLPQKSLCETALLAAGRQGAISLTKDKHNPEGGFFQRIDLLDVEILARFLGQAPYSSHLALASQQLNDHIGNHPVLSEVIKKWAAMGKVRSLGPNDVQTWLDAIRVISFCAERAIKDAISIPIREASAKLFNNSKRIERLVAPVDVLLQCSIESPPRPIPEVLGEIGLFREEQPILMAGNVTIIRTRLTAQLDAPYAGFAAYSVLGLASTPTLVMTIENLTTFHSEAKRRCDEPILLIYTAGMPSPAWRAMYARLLSSIQSTVPVFHWGDIDEGGFRIAAALAKVALAAGHALNPYAMSPDDVPPDMQNKASTRTLDRIRHFAAAAGWPELGLEISAAGFTVEQEGLDN